MMVIGPARLSCAGAAKRSSRWIRPGRPRGRLFRPPEPRPVSGADTLTIDAMLPLVRSSHDFSELGAAGDGLCRKVTGERQDKRTRARTASGSFDRPANRRGGGAGVFSTAMTASHRSSCCATAIAGERFLRRCGLFRHYGSDSPRTVRFSVSPCQGAVAARPGGGRSAQSEPKSVRRRCGLRCSCGRDHSRSWRPFRRMSRHRSVSRRAMRTCVLSASIGFRVMRLCAGFRAYATGRPGSTST